MGSSHQGQEMFCFADSNPTRNNVDKETFKRESLGKNTTVENAMVEVTNSKGRNIRTDLKVLYKL